MKQTKEPRTCEVKIFGRSELPATEPKICEVKIHGPKNLNPRIIKYNPAAAGMNQIAAQVANRLSHNTRSFKDGGSARLSLPEWQAIRKMPSVFKILLTQKIYESAPRLRREEFTLQLEGFLVLFIPGAKDF